MGSNGLFFSSSSSQGATVASNFQYVIDTLPDVSLPGSSSGTFTNTGTNNPLMASFFDDDAPKTGCKTLWIQDLVPILDPSKWINGLPTSIVKFNEQFPGVVAYVSSAQMMLYNEAQYNCVLMDLGAQNHGGTYTAQMSFGAMGPFRNIVPLFQPPNFGATNSLAGLSFTVNYFVDGVTTAAYVPQPPALISASVDPILNNAAQQGRLREFYGKAANGSSNLSFDVHHFQVKLNNPGSVPAALKIYGFMVYFEGATAGQNMGEYYPGNTYVGKNKLTTTSFSGFSLQSNFLIGSEYFLNKGPGSAYTLSIGGISNLITSALGTSGNNAILVTTGTGQSYLAGQGILAQAGTSFYVGAISSVSTDTFTVTPNLNTTVSGNLYPWFSAGTSLPAVNPLIHKLKWKTDFSDFVTGISFGYYNIGKEINLNFSQGTTSGIGNAPTQEIFNIIPQSNTAFGATPLIRLSPSWIYNGVQKYRFGYQLSGAQSQVIQIAGRFSAVEMMIEAIGGETLQMTVIANGFTSAVYSGGLGLPGGAFKKTIFTDGSQQWHELNLLVGSLGGNAYISGFNFYEYADPVGAPTLGLLAKVGQMCPYAKVPKQGSDLNGGGAYTAPGTYRRFGIDEILFTTSNYVSLAQGGSLAHTWQRVAGQSLQTQSYATTNNNGDGLDFSFFGNAFAIFGQSLGNYTSATLSVDGVGVGMTFGQFISVGSTDGFHEVIFQNQAANGQTISLYGIDILRNYTEVSNQQTLIIPFQNLPSLALGQKSVTLSTTYSANRFGIGPAAGIFAFGGTITPFGISTVMRNFAVKQISDSYRIRGTMVTYGVSAGPIGLNLPPGMLIDFSKLGLLPMDTTNQTTDYMNMTPIVGNFYYNENGDSGNQVFNNRSGVIFCNIGTPNYVYFGITTIPGGSYGTFAMQTIGTGVLARSPQQFYVDFEIPVTDQFTPGG